MIDKITPEELAIFETLANPICCTEIIFSDLGSLTEFTVDKYSKVRAYQFPMLSYETLFFVDPKLTDKENFNIKCGLGSSINFGGRLTGKSCIGIIVDVALSVIHGTFKWAAINSCDAVKIRGICETIINAFENHPLLKLWGMKSKAHPAYLMTFNNNTKIESINNDIAANKEKSGKNWFQKHVDKSWCEEASFLTDSISNKMLMAQSELGVVERLTGMSNFKKLSPIGRKFFDIKNENVIINLPSYANETWDKDKDDAAQQEFGGKQSPAYKCQILGQVVDDGDSVYDIERIRECYKRDKDGDLVLIKSFEVERKNFYRFKEIIILDRPANAESSWVGIDKGEGSAPTEVVILFKIGEQYKYEYNITLVKLSPDEDNEVVEYIIEQVKANYVGIDNTSGGGKAMVSYLVKKFPENIIPVDFNSKLDIDFAKDDKNEIIYEKGKPTFQSEFISSWSIQRLKQLFYNKKMLVLFDIKLDTQFDNIMAMQSGQRTIYKSKGADHLHQAFQVFSTIQWQYEFKLLQPVKKRKPGMGCF